MEDNHFKLLILAFIHQNHTIPTYLSWSRTKSPNHDSEVIMWPSLNLFLGLFLTSSVQSLNRVRFFATPWTAALQVSLSITNSWSLLKLMSIESLMPSNHLIICHPLLLPPSSFSSESVLHIRWPKNWSFSFSISPFNEYSGLISFRMDWFDLFPV